MKITPSSLKTVISRANGSSLVWIDVFFKTAFGTMFMWPVARAISLVFLGCTPVLAYSNLGGGIYQSNGTAADIQAAINAVPAGSIVQIPNGSYDWKNRGIVISRPLALLAQSVGGVTLTSSTAGATLITINKSAGGPIEVGGIIFDWIGFGYNGNYPIVTNGSSNLQPFLIHDCQFHSDNNYSVRVQGNGGVIWNCLYDTANDPNSGGYGFNFQGVDYFDWKTPSTMGTLDVRGNRNTYVENCRFVNAYISAINADDCSRVVFRYNSCNNSAVASHGQESSPQGVRSLEVYNNTFTYNTEGSDGAISYPLNVNYWINFRGGTGVVTRNTFPYISVGNKSTIQVEVDAINRCGEIPCPPGVGIYYPAPRQFAVGWTGKGPYGWGTGAVWDVDNGLNGLLAKGYPPDGFGYDIEPVYIWNNRGTGGDSGSNYLGVHQYMPDCCGKGQQVTNYVRQNRDYYLGVTSPTWTPYTYPHPFRALAKGSASGAATPAPFRRPRRPQRPDATPHTAQPLSFVQ